MLRSTFYKQKNQNEKLHNDEQDNIQWVETSIFKVHREPYEAVSRMKKTVEQNIRNRCLEQMLLL